MNWNFLTSTLYHNTILDWLIALGIMFAILIGLRIVRRIVVSRLSSLASRTATTVDDLVADTLSRTKFLFLLAVAIYFASRFLDFSVEVDSAIGKAALLVVFLQIAIWGNGLVGYLITRYVRLESAHGQDLQTSATVLVFLGKLLLWIFVFVLALDNLGFDITALLTGLGVGGIAVALAVQNILGDLFASLSIMLDRPFVVGDFIVTDGFACSIEKIGLKTTRARSITGEQVIFANSDLLKTRLRNFKRMQERRITQVIGVTFQTPHEKLQQIPSIMKEIIDQNEMVRFDRAHFKEFAASSLNFELVFWIKSPEYGVFMDAQQAFNLELYRRFEEEEIEFAYPTQTLFLNREDGVSDGDEDAVNSELQLRSERHRK